MIELYEAITFAVLGGLLGMFVGNLWNRLQVHNRRVERHKP